MYNDIPSCKQLQNYCLNNQHSVVREAQRLSLLKKVFKPFVSVTKLFEKILLAEALLFLAITILEKLHT